MERSCFQFAALVFLVNCFMAFSAGTITNFSTDQSSLLALRAHITADPYNILTNNWSTSTSICNWIGISCGIHHKRVTALNLSHMILTSIIPPHLGNLTFLISLDLSSNNFHGSIPHELAYLRRLEKFSLQFNNFTGEVPPWFGTLPRLHDLYLRNNSFVGSIPTSVFNNSKLETLDMKYNFLSGQIPEEIGNLSSLKLLKLRGNQLTGSIPSVIFNNMSSLLVIDLSANDLFDSLPVDMCNHLPKLEELSLSENQLFGQIPSNIYKCKELQLLSLFSNEFNGSIPREIGNLTMLKYIHLGDNGFNGTDRKMFLLTGPIESFFFNMSSLITLDLVSNSLSGHLPVDIHCNLPVLEEIYLGGNQLTGQIPSGLWGCKGLQRLQLTNNIFTGIISKNVGNLTLLSDLFLPGNNFTGTLPMEVGNLINLETIYVSGNNLTGPLPFQLFNSSAIKVIGLHFNHFSGHLPSSLGLYLPNLEELYLSRNNLVGIIPSSVSNASNLRNLELSKNLFTGVVPNTFGNLRLLRRLLLGNNNMRCESSTQELSFISSLTSCIHLKVLFLSENQLNGILPSSIGNLSTSLQIIEASECKFKGDIPSGIGNLSSLDRLNLGSNELTGFIPATIGSLKDLERLELGNNMMQGSIPNEVCLLKTIGLLRLSANKLNGSIPACLGELKSMRQLYLNSNKFTSMIPSTFWNLKDLLDLDLSSNFLSGYLPSDIQNLKVISQMDLSWNDFSGNIPSSIGGVQTLTTLSLAHNKFQGSIPQSVGNLINLELLDLSHNNLSGEIPKSLEALRYLSYFNVSFNKLQGKIPGGGHFSNFTANSFMENDGLCGAPQLHVQPCKAKTLRRSWSKKISLLKYISAPIITVILAVAVIFVLKRCRKRNVKLLTQKDSLPLSWIRISYHELLQATNAFCESNLLGMGGVGSVYKGTLSDGTNVAVKVFNLKTEWSFNSFDVECEILRNVRHRNLVKIISSCTNLDFKALVLEYMPNGSLEQWLYSYNSYLDVLQRLNIMIDVASAIEYLHHGYMTPIVHCDLKPSNILLDEDMVARVCDFGIAKLLGKEEFMAQTKTLATIGYMAPEYGAEGIVSTKGDVYSYGVILMETFTRKKPTNEMFSEQLTLRSWVNEALQGSILQVVDSNLMGVFDENSHAKDQCMSSVLHLAIDCSTTKPIERINIEDVVVRLKKIKSTFLETTKSK